MRCFKACVAVADCEPGRSLVGEAEQSLEERVAREDIATGVWRDVECAVVHGRLGC